MEPNMEGGCTCRQVRYRLIGTPMIVHACHCRWCQRETGTAHALNALYEADRVVHTAGEPEIIVTPSASGKGQRIARCPTCATTRKRVPPSGSSASAPWTILISVRRTSTFSLPPSCHGVTLAAGAKVVPEFYDLNAVWSAESLERRRLMRTKAQQT